MGRVLVVDGPEKAGKTTLCRQLCRELNLEYRHWGPVAHATEFGRALRADLQHDRDWCWDRSWASEAVYSRYFSRPSQIADDHWLGEWLYSNAVKTWGLRVMLPWAYCAHDETDLPIPQDLEIQAFKTYADYWGWLRPSQGGTLEQVARAWLANHQWEEARPPAWVGPSWSPVVVVGEERNDPGRWSVGAGSSPYPGPFSSRYTWQLARSLGFSAFDVGWTNMDECPPGLLAGKYVAALGGLATRWCEALDGPLDVRPFRHPSWLYRWGAAKREVALQEAEFVRYVRTGLDLGVPIL